MDEKKVSVVIKMVQNLIELDNNPNIDYSYLAEKLDNTIVHNNIMISQEEQVYIESALIQRYAVRIGNSTVIVDKSKPEVWISSQTKKEWNYWERYKQYLNNFLADAIINELDQTTDKILNLLNDPVKSGVWDRRGLVVGHVQSGKTSNYTGLVCKAADAGYRIIIILAGLHNNLRAQTQVRLEEGFLGISTASSNGPHELVGVGNINKSPDLRPHYATTRLDNGDFKQQYVDHLGFTPEQKPCLFVVKKNYSVLRALNQWIAGRLHAVNMLEGEEKIIPDIPLLLIDDEADNASIDTRQNIMDDEGTPNRDHDPTSINREIRKLIKRFAKSAYVGYTATPFANIFIHNQGCTTDEGEDLFPSSFILNLSAPSNYLGPNKFFGHNSDDQPELYPLLRIIPDSEGWIPPRHKKTYRLPSYGSYSIPNSLQEAILSFVLSCTVRKIRGTGKRHCSMLIHVTRFTNVQEQVRNAVFDYFQNVYNRLSRNINAQELWEKIHGLWYEDYVNTTTQILDSGVKIRAEYEIQDLPLWDTVKEEIIDVMGDIEDNIVCINGYSQDALYYEDNKKLGLKTIVIGGDKLSRGLTLEGLSVSYFMRASQMYDTLMQMGRWFGYRQGYMDVCRLYLTEELSNWFSIITDANEELREEFDVAVDRGLTPEEYGLKVKTHSGLKITSPLKMRASQEELITYSGHISETVSFYKTEAILNRNREALDSLLLSIGNAAIVHPAYKTDYRNQTWDDSYLWQDVDSDKIISFLHKYRTSQDARFVDSDPMAEYIQEMNNSCELEQWNVALIGGGRTDMYEQVTDVIRIRPLERSITRYSCDSDSFSIKRLISNRDETIDFDSKTWLQALNLTLEEYKNDPGGAKKVPQEPSGTIIRRMRGYGYPNRGIQPTRKPLLLLYLLRCSKKEDDMINVSGLTTGFAISFPYSSNNSIAVKYRVNSIWQQLNDYEWRNEDDN